VTPGAQVLVVNAGSSTLKYQLYDVDRHAAVTTGLIDRVTDHRAALEEMLTALGTPLPDLLGVGHRIVHGGARFTEPTLIDRTVEAAIEDLISLAPLHNPANLAGVHALRRLLPDTPQVAVFDTAFHATIPLVAATYAIPAALAERHGIRRYGFHGTSCRYVTRRTAEHLGVRTDGVNLIVCHLGNGASVTAVADGRSVDTSMGMSPLAGLVMGTRCGDLDPAVPFHLQRQTGLTAMQVETVLTRESGLAGLCGDSDMREVKARAQTGDPAARQAREVYAYRIRHYLGAYLAVLPRVDALVFTAGVGENDAELRADVCGPVAHLGLSLDAAANADAVNGRDGPAAIGTGRIPVLVVPTDEEAEIADETAQIVRSLGGPHVST
jgi:acetate kinase